MTSLPIDSLIKLAKTYSGTINPDPKRLKGDGSDRQIYRFDKKDKNFIGITNPSKEENQAFLYFSKHFIEIGIPVPEILMEDLSNDCYLTQDLGDTNLADLIDEWNTPKQLNYSAVLDAYEKVISWMPKIHFQSHIGMNYDFCHVPKELNQQSFEADIEYFKTYFWKLFASKYPLNTEIVNELNILLKKLGQIKRTGFVHRDFQSRNIMWKNDSPYFIDYQSGCHGAIHYDLATLLYASRAGLNNEQRTHLINHFIDTTHSLFKINPEQFIKEFYLFVLVRRLRSLGTYGFLPYKKNKLYFLDAIPNTIFEILYLLNNHPSLSFLPHLKALFQQWAQDDILSSDNQLHSFISKLRSSKIP